MRKLLVSTLIASGLTIAGVSSFAVDEQPKDAQTEEQVQEGAEQAVEAPTEIRGEVTSFKDTTVEIKDEAGETHSFDITGLQNEEDLKAEALKPGDMVRVEMAGGKPTLIEKVEAKTDAASEEAPDVAKEDAQDTESMKEDAAKPESELSDEAAPAEEGLEGEEQAAEVGEGEYIVKEGDTLASIAEEHLGSQEDWSIIAKANNLEDPDKLFIGQRLTIPSSDAGSEELKQEQAPQTEPMKDDTESAPAPEENY